MTLGTKIEWAHATFNPWIGCTPVSVACDYCYAETLAKRYGWATWGAGQPRKRTSDAYWRQPLAWDRKAAKAGKPLRVFSASLADVFDAEVPDSWRDGLFQLIDETPHLIWMLLTKRPNVALKYLGDAPARPNVWLGTTVENQAMADLRIPLLLQVPAAKHFLSCEPLLGPVDLTRIPHKYGWGTALEPGEIHGGTGQCVAVRPALDWVITGGESGPHARPSHPDWFRSLRDQCQAAGVPYFFKQWGEFAPMKSAPYSSFIAEIQVDGEQRCTDFGAPTGALMSRVGKARAGRLLDGREWNEVPT